MYHSPSATSATSATIEDLLIDRGVRKGHAHAIEKYYSQRLHPGALLAAVLSNDLFSAVAIEQTRNAKANKSLKPDQKISVGYIDLVNLTLAIWDVLPICSYGTRYFFE